MTDKKIAKRKIDKAWSAKNRVARGDVLHKENQRESSYCGLKGKVLWQHANGVQKHNMSIAIEKRIMRRLGLSIEGTSYGHSSRAFKGDACHTP